MLPKTWDVVAVGHACTDLLARVPHLPVAGRKLEVERILVLAGGPAATAAVTVARLGRRSAFIGQIGQGPLADIALASLRQAGVDTTGVESRSVEGGRVALVLVDAVSAERTIVFTRSGLPGLDPERLDRGRVLAGRILLVDDLDIPAAVQAARWAREASVPVVLDAGTARPGVEDLVALSDVVIGSAHFMPSLLGVDDIQQGLRELRSRGPGLTGVTLGDRGAVLWNGVRLFEQPAFTVEAQDTTGAGDVFHGAFAFGMLESWDLDRTLRFAAAAAALSCTKLGAQVGAPTRAEVDSLLRRGERC